MGKSRKWNFLFQCKWGINCSEKQINKYPFVQNCRKLAAWCLVDVCLSLLDLPNDNGIFYFGGAAQEETWRSGKFTHQAFSQGTRRYRRRTHPMWGLFSSPGTEAEGFQCRDSQGAFRAAWLQTHRAAKQEMGKGRIALSIWQEPLIPGVRKGSFGHESSCAGYSSSPLKSPKSTEWNNEPLHVQIKRQALKWREPGVWSVPFHPKVATLGCQCR